MLLDLEEEIVELYFQVITSQMSQLHIYIAINVIKGLIAMESSFIQY